MRFQEAGLSDVRNITVLVRFFIWGWTKVGDIFVWFVPLKKDYPANEAGELMRRFMMHKSWFDKLSSLWVEQTFWVKAISIVGLILFTGLVGVLIGASIILPFSAAFFSIFAHVLFVSHEQHRWQGAALWAAESIALHEELNETKLFLEHAAGAVNTAATEMIGHTDTIKGQAVMLDSECQTIHKRNETLITIVEEVKMDKESLLEKDKAVQADFEMISGDLKQLDHVIIQTTESTQAVKDAISQFSGTVHDIQNSQKAFSTAAQKFCFFIDERVGTKTPELQLGMNDSVDSLNKELDENDRLIEEMKKRMMH